VEGELGRAGYLQLEKPSSASRAPLRDGRRPACTTPSSTAASTAGKMCMQQMMAIDAAGGMGKARRGARFPAWRPHPMRPTVAGMCTWAQRPDDAARTMT
jgi:cytochrome o ubiquinol oxidase subunit 2